MPDEAVAEAPKKLTQIEKMNAARAAKKAEREALAAAQREKTAKMQAAPGSAPQSAKKHEDDLDENREEIEYTNPDRCACSCGAKLFCYKGKTKFHCIRFMKGGEPTKICQKNLPRYGVDEKGVKVTLIYADHETPPPNDVDAMDDEAVDLES